MCMHIKFWYVPRERPPPPPPHFQPEISVPEHIIFTNDQKIRSGAASPVNIFSPFWRPSFSKFIELQPIHRLPRPAQAAPWVSGQPECQPDASWQFRRPAFSHSKRLKLGPEPRIFTLKTAQARSGAPDFTLDRGARSGARARFSLCRGTYLPKFGVSTPPPPPPGSDSTREHLKS